MNNLKRANDLIDNLQGSINNKKQLNSNEVFTGIDLGTSAVVITVVNDNLEPVAVAYEFADVVKDGMVVDYLGSIEILKRLKSDIESRIDMDLVDSSVAIPPGTETIDGGAVVNVAEAAGFSVIEVLDEPTAANNVLNIKNGAVVDIGGGTTGISIIKNGKLLKSVDEATGGKHFTLVLAGAYNISYDEAEKFKRNFSKHKEIFPILTPVLDKIVSIILSSIEGYDLDEIVLVGGTALLTGIEGYIEKKTGIKTVKPANPMFVTPLGLALNLTIKDD